MKCAPEECVNRNAKKEWKNNNFVVDELNIDNTRHTDYLLFFYCGFFNQTKNFQLTLAEIREVKYA
jgi:hypothetical protein